MSKANKKLQGIAKIIMLAKNEDEVIGIMHDILTESEIEKVHERIKVFACLKDGLSYRETSREADSAIATVSHGARFLRKSAMVIRKILDSAQKMNWWYKLFWRT